MREGISDSPSAKSARDAVHRSFTKPRKVGFNQALLNSIKQIPIYSGGIYVGNAITYDVNLDRLCNVIERIARGLYSVEFNKRLPATHMCKTYAMDGFSSVPNDVSRDVNKLWTLAVSGKAHDFGRADFIYWVQELDGSETSSLWGFLIYSTFAFVALTGPREKDAGIISTRYDQF